MSNHIGQLISNKALLIEQKKSTMKYADAVGVSFKVYEKQDSSKALTVEEIKDLEEIYVKSVINTTNLLDSHGDVHIKGLWKKSLNESKNLFLLEQHKMDFDHLISDDVSAKAEEFEWKDLGYNYEGKTQALVFMTKISKSQHPKMFDRYAKGQVKNHSVGMRYVKLFLAVSDKRYKEENEVWEKYINEIANKEVAEEQGYFWAVTEAKAIEGSAVLLGSNFATPTIEVTAAKGTDIEEPSNDTRKETIDYLTQNFKLN
jgi:hypothetical protein